MDEADVAPEAAKLVRYAFDALDALGVNSGPCHTELVLLEDGSPYAARPTEPTTCGCYNTPLLSWSSWL